MAENTERAAQRSGGEENRSAEPVVLCGANSYQQKYYFNKEFKRLPESIQQELQIMCVLFTEDIGGVLMLENRPGEGLRVTVSLPVRRPEQPPVLRTPQRAADRTGGFPQVLIELSSVLPWQSFTPDTLE